MDGSMTGPTLGGLNRLNGFGFKLPPLVSNDGIQELRVVEDIDILYVSDSLELLLHYCDMSWGKFFSQNKCDESMKI